MEVSEKVAETIGKHCSLITSLRMLRPFEDNKGASMMSMMEAIPGQQLKTFQLFAYVDYFPDRLGLLGPDIRRHFRGLS